MSEKQTSSPNWVNALFSRTMLICVATGFASGLPLYLLLQLLPAWLKTEGISKTSISMFALAQIPYTWKFVWAPLMDRYSPFKMGRRRGWMLLTQVALIVFIGSLGFFSPTLDIYLIVYVTLAIAFFSASQDIALDAFRREILSDAELGLGNSIHVNAYRIAGLIPGSLSLILADHMPWRAVFMITALFMLPGLVMTLLVKEPKVAAETPKTLSQIITEPILEFFGRNGVQSALLILAFIFLYKLGDSMATALATPFYMEMGFSKSDIGLVAKHAALWPSVIGGLLGGIWMLKLGINRALWLFGIVQVVSIIGFFWLSLQRGFSVIGLVEYCKLALVIGFEALGVGLGSAAFVAFIARTTNPLYTATQFALFTSLASVPRTVINASTGWLVEQLGWPMFFWLCTAVAIPGMLLLLKVAPWNSGNTGIKP